jgi:5-bromo-4-chloroindolyl phosphate hydrolysis protein
MSTHTALFVGVLVGVLAMMTLVMSVMVRFVSSDVDGFRRWLDRTES